MSFFAPATALMNRLRYPAKFTVITVLFVIPIAWGAVQFWRSIDSSAAFSVKEHIGNEYLQPLTASLFDVPALRVEKRAGAGLVVQKRIEALPKRVGQEQTTSGETLQTTAQYEKLLKSWDTLKAARTSVQIDVAQNDFVAALRALIDTVGDKSNLILDPDLDTYYLMDATLLKLPEAGEHMIAAQRLLESTGLSDSVTPVQESLLVGLARLLESNTNQMVSGITKAYDNNPAGNVRPKLSVDLEKNRTVRKALIESLRSRANGFAVPDLQAHFDSVIASDSNFVQEAFAENGYLIARRVEGYRSQQR